MIGWSIRTQFTVLVLVLCTTIAALLWVVLPTRIEAMGTASIERRAIALAGVLGSAVAPAIDFDDDTSANDTLIHLATNREVQFAAVYGREQRRLAVLHTEELPAALGDLHIEQIAVSFDDDHALVIAPVRTASGATGALVLGLSLDGLHADIRAGRILVLEVMGAVLLLGVGFAWTLGALLVRPIRRVVDTARRVADGDLSVEGIGLDPVGPWRDSANETIRLTGAVSEMAHRLATQMQSLREAEQEARAGSEAKSAFLANMSHELRTPLNAIIGYSEILLEDLSPDPERCEDLRRIWLSGTHLLNLINDILDLAKIESGKMDTVIEEIAVGPLLDEVLASVRPTAERNGNQIRTSIEIDRPVFTDGTKLRRILANLASNAVKFTHNGTVTVRARRSGEVLVFEIADDGIGIAQDQLDRLFQPFVQADASTTRKYGGTGLGLALVRHTCQLLGGEVAVRSVLGKGSTFTATVLDHQPTAGRARGLVPSESSSSGFPA